MKIKLDLEKKQIEIIGEVNVEELFKTVEKFNIETTEWTIISSKEYVYPFIPNEPTPYIPPYNPTCEPNTYPSTPQIWYTTSM